MLLFAVDAIFHCFLLIMCATQFRLLVAVRASLALAAWLGAETWEGDE